MRILYICNEYPPHLHGGIGSFTRDIAEAMVNAGHQVDVWGMYEDLDACREEWIRGVRVFRTRSRKDAGRWDAVLFRYELYRKLKRFLQHRSFDIIECQEWRGLLPFGIQHDRFVVRLHGSALFFDQLLNRAGGRLSHWFERMQMKRAENLVAVSDFCGYKTLELAGLKKKYTVIYNAVDQRRLELVGQQFNTIPGKIVFANTVAPKKGVFQLLEAFLLLADDYPHIELFIIGKLEYRQNGKGIKEMLWSKIPEHCQTRVHITGWLPTSQEVYQHLAEAEICVYPSHMEGFGIAPVEPMAMGKPVLFMNNGPGPEVIEDGVSGILIQAMQADSIADGIRWVLENPAKARELGKNARERVAQKFDKATVFTQQNLAYYQHLQPQGPHKKQAPASRNVLFVCNEYPPALHGGIGIFVKDVAENMVKHGHQVCVVGVYPQSEKTVEYVEGVQVIRLPMPKYVRHLPVKKILRSWKAKQLVSDEIDRLHHSFKPDWIESYDWDGPLVRKPMAPLIVRLHGSHTAHALKLQEKKSFWTAYWEKRNYKMADKLVAVSDYIFHSSRHAFGQPKVFMERIYNSYNELLFFPDPATDRDEFLIFYPGKFHERKGVYELFQILDQLFRRDERFHFLFVGHHTPTNKETLMGLLSPEYHNRVKFKQAVPQSDLPPFYRKAGIVIIPSRVEAFGLTAIEAMACGALTAMADVSAAREIIQDHVDGLLINPFEAEATANTLWQVMQNDALKEKIRQQAYQKALNTFSAQVIFEQNLRCYLHD